MIEQVYLKKIVDSLMLIRLINNALSFDSFSERVWSPLDLPTLVAESTSNPPDRIFWKATLLLPSDQDSHMSR